MISPRLYPAKLCSFNVLVLIVDAITNILLKDRYDDYSDMSLFSSGTVVVLS